MKKIHELQIKKAELTDLPAIIHLENATWNKQQRCSGKKLLARLVNYQNGFLLGHINGEVVASFYAIKRKHHPHEAMNWLRDSGDGTGGTQDQMGNSLFSISITVSARAPKGSYRRMMEAWRELAKQEKVEYMYAGSRLPGLKDFAGTADEYLSSVKNGAIFDPILSKARASGFTLGNLIPNYFNDPDSLNFGVEIFQVID